MKNRKGKVTPAAPAGSGSLDDPRLKSDDSGRAPFHESDNTFFTVRELRHRLRGDLQTVASLIDLAALSCDHAQFADSAARDRIFNGLKARVQSLALVHSLLYDTGFTREVEFRGYVLEISRMLKNIHCSNDLTKIEVTGEGPVFLPYERAVPFGLAISEAIFNSLNHGRPGLEPGHIRVFLEQSCGPAEDGLLFETGHILAEISDNGPGMTGPPSCQTIGAPPPSHGQRTGLKLMKNIVHRQLGGTLELKNGPPREPCSAKEPNPDLTGLWVIMKIPIKIAGKSRELARS